MSPTFRLFAMPTYLEGIGSVWDLAGSSNNYNFSESPKYADYLAIRSDFEAINNDFQQVFFQLEEEMIDE